MTMTDVDVMPTDLRVAVIRVRMAVRATQAHVMVLTVDAVRTVRILELRRYSRAMTTVKVDCGIPC